MNQLLLLNSQCNISYHHLHNVPNQKHEYYPNFLCLSDYYRCFRSPLIFSHLDKFDSFTLPSLLWDMTSHLEIQAQTIHLSSSKCKYDVIVLIKGYLWQISVNFSRVYTINSDVLDFFGQLGYTRNYFLETTFL